MYSRAQQWRSADGDCSIMSELVYSKAANGGNSVAITQLHEREWCTDQDEPRCHLHHSQYSRCKVSFTVPPPCLVLPNIRIRTSAFFHCIVLLIGLCLQFFGRNPGLSIIKFSSLASLIMTDLLVVKSGNVL